MKQRKDDFGRDAGTAVLEALYGSRAGRAVSEAEQKSGPQHGAERKFVTPLVIHGVPGSGKTDVIPNLLTGSPLQIEDRADHVWQGLKLPWLFFYPGAGSSAERSFWEQTKVDFIGHGNFGELNAEVLKPLSLKWRLYNPKVSERSPIAAKPATEREFGKKFYRCLDFSPEAAGTSRDYPLQTVDRPMVSPEQRGSLARSKHLSAILDSLEAKSVANEAFGDEVKELALLLEERPETGAMLIGMIQRQEGHARVRWLVIEEMAKMQQPLPTLVPSLIAGLCEWDEGTEALALLGAAVALNLLSVPMDQHAAIRAALKPRLEAVELRNLDPLRTEMVCQLLSTLGSYAESEDLEVMAPFWGRGATYTVRLASMDAATRVVRCFPGSPETDRLFATQGEVLARLGSSLIEVIDIPENAAVLHSTMRLLAARLGPEARALVDFADADRSLARQIAQVLTSSARELVEVGQNEWLESRKSDLETTRSEINALAVARKVVLRSKEPSSAETFVREG